MTTFRIPYDLQSGYVHDWLVLGPLHTPVDQAQARLLPLEQRLADFSASAPAAPLADQPPTQLDKIVMGETAYFWKLEHASDDHRVERSLRLPGLEHAQLWAFCILHAGTAQAVEAELLTTCPAALWLNGEPCPAHQEPNLAEKDACLPEIRATMRLVLREGENPLWLLLDDTARGEITLSAQLHISDGQAGRGLRVAIPVLSPEVDYWKEMEAAYASARLDRPVYADADPITLFGPEKQERLQRTNVRLQKTSGEIYGEFQVPLFVGEPMPLAVGSQLPSGEYQALLMPPPEHYYELQFRPARLIPFQVINETYYPSAKFPYEQRRTQLLLEAERQGGLFGQAAALAMGHMNRFDPAAVQSAIQRVTRAEDGCLLDLLGLWLVQALAGEQPAGGHFSEGLRQEIESAVTAFAYSGAPIAVESDRLLCSACQALAGQAFPAAVFPAEGAAGREVQAAGEEWAVDWLRQRAFWGGVEWNAHLNELTAALSVVTAHSSNETLSELAAVFLDKLFFSLAGRAFYGLPDPVGPAAPGGSLKSALLQPGAALGLLLWGEGANTGSLVGAVCLAICADYQLPELIEAIAADHSTEMWAVERNRPEGLDNESSVYSIYKTPDFRLSSIQFETAGRQGCREHAWQATLGSEALVFSSDPGSSSQSAHRPGGFWRGNRRVPQVGQWKDALICRYFAPLEGPLLFTHAYFPVFALDEYRFSGGWALARKDDAYLALYADQVLAPVTTGEDAWRELRSSGVTWVCQMGRREADGSFEDFCGKVLAVPPRIDATQVVWKTLRGDTLQLDSGGVLVINGQPRAPEKAIDSPYAEVDLPAQIMTIHYNNQGLELRFD